MFGPTLALGRIVHYVMQASDFGPSSVYLAKAQAKGQAAVMSIVRPAVIVETWGNDKQSDETKWTVNLLVFVDGANDGYPIVPAPDPAQPPGVPVVQLWKTSVSHDEATKAPGTWHWPER